MTPTGARSPRQGSSSLADLLERVLDKGVVIAGDIVVDILDIELLTLKVRLLVASLDTAEQLGIDWWKSDPFLSSHAQQRRQEGDGTSRAELEARNHELEDRVSRLEHLLEQARPDAAEERKPEGGRG